MWSERADPTSPPAPSRTVFPRVRPSSSGEKSADSLSVFPQLLYILIPIPLPLSALLILVIDLGFELFVALTFAFDPPESADAIMRLPPRKPVNERTIRSIKTKALRRTKTQVIDPETYEPVKPTLFARALETVSAPFTRQYWSDKFEKTEGEVLVDGNLLSYSYLEAGMIELLGWYVAPVPSAVLTSCSLFGYFVVFNASGFSPSDLQRAQRAQNADPPIRTSTSARERP